MVSPAWTAVGASAVPRPLMSWSEGAPPAPVLNETALMAAAPLSRDYTVTEPEPTQPIVVAETGLALPLHTRPPGPGSPLALPMTTPWRIIMFCDANVVLPVGVVLKIILVL